MKNFLKIRIKGFFGKQLRSGIIEVTNPEIPPVLLEKNIEKRH